jgi:hypothetical protein
VAPKKCPRRVTNGLSLVSQPTENVSADFVYRSLVESSPPTPLKLRITKPISFEIAVVTVNDGVADSTVVFDLVSTYTAG